MRVLNVTADGAQAGWSYLAQCVASMRPGGFIGLDTEFSGLCSPKRLEHADLAVRYAALRELATERAMLSLGLSLFNPTEKGDSYEVTTLDFLLNCTSMYSIKHDAGAFLVSHGYDFNKMYARGIPYARAEDVEKDGKGRGTGARFEWGPWPRGLLWRLGRAGVPIIVHNGFVDLVFLFCAFQAPLPITLGSFVSAIVDCLPAGVYDTKLIAMGVANESRTFLTYLFAKSVGDGNIMVRERKNAPLAGTFDPKIENEEKRNELCKLFAVNGACIRGVKCPFLHDAFLVVEAVKKGLLPKNAQEERKEAKKQHKLLKRELREVVGNVKLKRLSKKAKKRLRAAEALAAAQAKKTKQLGGKKMKIETVEQPFLNVETTELSGAKKRKIEIVDKLGAKKQKLETVEDVDVVEADNSYVAKSGVGNGENGVLPISGNTREESAAFLRSKKEHSAGWDSFCTAYVFASFRAALPKKDVDELHNRVRMMGKGRPLWLHKSKFADADEIKLVVEEKQTQNVDAADGTDEKDKI